MEGPAVAPDGDSLFWFPQQAGVAPDKLASLRPDFLVISPPKTGSTWLAANFRRHPQLFVPAVKELKYFSSLFKWHDLNWYLNQFGPAAGRMKGEASPSYALLPVRRIRLVRDLLPDVKLIFLMRDPAGRAWSHAKHNHFYREANFDGCTASFEDVTEGQWRDNFAHQWPLASGDYLGQLRRWTAVFPRKQLFVGFYEDLGRRPEGLLRDLFAFLGVDPDVDLSAFPVLERVLAGQPGKLPPGLECDLSELLHDRTEELASYLRDRFGLTPPPEWDATLAAAPGSAPGVPEAFRGEFDDLYLSRVLAQEETFPSPPVLVLEGYRGFNVVRWRGRLYALDQALGPAGLAEMDAAEVRRREEGGRCFIAPSLAEVKERVDRHVFARTEAQLRTIERLQDDLRDARDRVARLEDGLAETADRLRRLEADAVRLSPRQRALARFFYRAWGRLRAALRPGWPGRAPRSDSPRQASLAGEGAPNLLPANRA